VSEQPDASDELPAIAGVYVETSRYRRLVSLEQQARAFLDALQQARQPEEIAQALQLAIAGSDDAAESSLALDASRWELYLAFSALIEASGWTPPA
jgi:hypothetical protein